MSRLGAADGELSADPVAAFQHGRSGAQLVCDGGSLKIVYDLTLLKMFRDVKPPEEQ